jgi:hypothetical protein
MDKDQSKNRDLMRELDRKLEATGDKLHFARSLLNQELRKAQRKTYYDQRDKKPRIYA